MNLKLAVLALALLPATAFADTVTVNLGESNEIYHLDGTGGSNGFGTYLAQQGDCVAGATRTTCTLTGAFTGSTTGYTSGGYTLVTSYNNSDGGLAATSTEKVTSDTTGNFFTFNPFLPDVMMSVILNDVTGTEDVPIVTNGAVANISLSLYGVTPMCSGLPNGVECTQGFVGMNAGSSIFSEADGTLTFDAPSASAVPEPEWLALGGLIPGALLTLRRFSKRR